MVATSRLRSSTRASTVASESLAETETKVRSETRKTTSVKPVKGNELVRLKRIAAVAYLLSTAIIVGVIYFSLNDVIRLYPKSMESKSLSGFNSRAEFSLRYQTLLYFWLMIYTQFVIYKRFKFTALNPLVDSTEKHMMPYKNILVNSFEQTLMSSVLQLAFASFADGSMALKLIPAINFAQFIGRITFAMGYPYYRTFGMTMTLTPNLILVGYNMYKFAYLSPPFYSLKRVLRFLAASFLS